MFVRDKMSTPVVTILENETVYEAMHILKEKKIRRLPVVNSKGTLVGIAADIDLQEFSPSRSTSLDRFELHYLISKTPVKTVMTKNPITVDADAPIEEAALLMSKHNIGGLPVMEKGKLSGIITEVDLFNAMLEILGMSEGGSRICLMMKDQPGELARIVNLISKRDINILSIATYGHPVLTDRRGIIIRLGIDNANDVREEIKKLGYTTCAEAME